MGNHPPRSKTFNKHRKQVLGSQTTEKMATRFAAETNCSRFCCPGSNYQRQNPNCGYNSNAATQNWHGQRQKENQRLGIMAGASSVWLRGRSKAWIPVS
mmetsp:Transcript_68548/g.135506  ORF Transcript_68548/g.135506 Transcript_68548/m.135506 type:complete len:99 (-) Transcript_68548:820-1116(-)